MPIALCAANGCAALIYLAVWLQLLEPVVGSSLTTRAALIGTLLACTCLGSLLFPRVVSAKHNPLRVFAVLQLGIAAAGMGILYGIPLIGGVFAAAMIGATLPAIALYLGVACYSANAAGAAAGTLLATFYLLRVHDVAIATFAAAAINLAAALAGLTIAKPALFLKKDVSTTPGTWRVCLTIAISGMTALGAEVIWSRHLAILFGATVYTFALTVAVFLAGVAIGSAAGAVLSRSLTRPRLALAVCQFLLCGAIAWAAYAVASSMPYWPINPSITRNAWLNFQFDLFRCIWAVFPAACLWGAAFPLASASIASRGQDAWAANIAGAIAGVVFFWIGSQYGQRALIILSAGAGLLVWGSQKRLIASAGVIGAALLAWSVPSVSDEFLAFGRFLPERGRTAKVVFAAEGRNASVAVTQDAQGMLGFHRSGETRDMRWQRMTGHLSSLAPQDTQSFLVMGFSAGSAAGAVSLNPEAKRIVITETEPLVPEVAARYFGGENYDVARNPKVELRIEDGRRYLAATSEKFDGIISDLPHPWVKGAAALYTREFFELVKAHLNPGGVFAVFVSLYENSEDAIKSEFATFFEVFPEGTVLVDVQGRYGYEAVLFDHAINVARIDQRLRQPDYARVRDSLPQAPGLLQRSDFAHWLEGGVINRDRDLRLQYLAGRGLNVLLSEVIYRRMTSRELR